MARPRKYATEAERTEAYKKANRDRQKRYQDAKKAEKEECIRRLFDNSDCELPTPEQLANDTSVQQGPRTSPRFATVQGPVDPDIDGIILD